MKRMCREVQERLADEGAQALRADAAAQRHLEECPECFSVLEGLARLDQALGAMPALDPPERAVSELLARVEGEAVPASPPADPPTRGLETLGAVARPRFMARGLVWGMGTAASVSFAVFLLLIGGTATFWREAGVAPQRGNEAPPQSEQERVAELDKNLRVGAGGATVEKEKAEEARPRVAEAEADRLRALGYVADEKAGSEAAPKKLEERRQGELHLSSGSVVFERDSTSRYEPAPQGDRSGAPASHKQKRPNAKTGEKDERKAVDLPDASGTEGGVPGGVFGSALGGLPEGTPPPAAVRVGGAVKAPRLLRSVAPAYPPIALRQRVEGVVVLEIEIGVGGKVTQARVLRSVPLLDAVALEAVKQWVYQPTLLNGRPIPVLMTVTLNFRLPAASPEPSPGKPSSDRGSEGPVQAFFAERAATEGLSFQPPRGYWANTYVPGDPALRLLRARLLAWDRAPLQAPAGFPLRLHDASTPPSQPFDPPRSAGLALYVHADRRGLVGPRRMLVQVGLKGSRRSGGPRPPMNLGLVLDLRGHVPVEVAADMRALALAFSEAKAAGDRFSLIVAGRPGGVALGPQQFKHGPLAVAFDRLFAGTTPQAGASLDLAGAVAAAFQQASHRDDPDAALGGSAVVVVTAQPLGDAADALADLAHQGALAGIPLSVVGLGAEVPVSEMDRLALAGQGSRRLLHARSDATRLVEAELAAASDVVARAVRLRIRLAPGVRLVAVVGSRRLDDALAQRVRETERSIDLRLARDLGLESDRGEDEDGIQIVIPVFHAGDAHAVLLDVVAPGPGPVADVSVRYKDLVFLRNGVARASLSLPSGAPAAGPLERNVLKNLLALRLAQALAAAGTALDAGDAAGAAGLVERALALRTGLMACVPGLAGDGELARDVAMLQEYERLLASGAPPTQLTHIADSLRYAGRLKQLPRPSALVLGAL